MSAACAGDARRERREALEVALPTPEPEPEMVDGAASPPILRHEVALWRQQSERLLQRASRAVPTATMLAATAEFARLAAAVESELVQATALLAFEANPDALRCVLKFLVSAGSANSRWAAPCPSAAPCPWPSHLLPLQTTDQIHM